ncbi:amino acid permease [Francisellaceae bacterium CB52]
MMSKLNRSLKSRHLVMMALGGTIGTGLLLASGGAIHSGGPGGAIAGYIIVSIIVYFLMSSLGEMAAHSPVTGSFCEYSAKYVDKSFGFAMSWNYWLNWVLVVASEIIAAGLVMQYWFPDVNISWWIGLFFLLICFINVLSVRVYGEAEYWLSIIKIATVVIFITVGTLVIFGLVGSQGVVGFKNIHIGDGPFHAGWLGFFSVFLVAGYSLQGAELIGVTAGETENPKVTLPKAIKKVFWRLILFYVLTIIIISLLIPYNSPSLISDNSDVALSPFTIVLESAGIKYAASLMNLVVITAILSAANASMYTASRMLWHMGESTEAPKFFSKTNKENVPIVGMISTAIICFILLILSFTNGGMIFNWLINVISLAGYIAWFGICLSHYRFRRAYLKQGKQLSQLPFRAKWFPVAPILAMVVIIIIMVGQQLLAIFEGEASFSSFLATYSGVILFLLLMIFHKLIKKTKLAKLEEISL